MLPLKQGRGSTDTISVKFADGAGGVAGTYNFDFTLGTTPDETPLCSHPRRPLILLKTGQTLPIQANATDNRGLE